MDNPWRIYAEMVGDKELPGSPPGVPVFLANLMMTLLGVVCMMVSAWSIWFAIHLNVEYNLGLAPVEPLLNTSILGFACGLITVCFATSRACEIYAIRKICRQVEKDFIEKVLDEYHQRGSIHPRILQRIVRTEAQRYKDM